MKFKFSLVLFLLVLLSGCSKTYVNQQVQGKPFPSVRGEGLDKNDYQLPEQFAGTPTLLLLGYKQQSQFDIDRWLIGLDMKQVPVAVYEIPTIQGWLPRQIKGFINEGMRKGIPEELWSIVITVYQEGETLQAFTGNENPNNARVVLLDGQGQVIWFHDRGFSVAALNRVKDKVLSLQAQ